jgi:multidrug efflux system outer membrane protein
VDSLVALTGRDASAVRALVPLPFASSRDPDTALTDTQRVAPPPIVEVDPADLMPVPPPTALALPATVLLRHPRVISAGREVAASWSDIAVTRADRLPTIDLAAALSGNWLQAFGRSVGFAAWNVGGDLTTPLFDGGAGAARVHGAQARYAAALAVLHETLRSVAQEVEDALAAQSSAEQRLKTSHQAVRSGRVSVLASEARWRAGSISLFELEEARRQFNDAQETEIAAAHDRAQAWVELIRASGNSVSGEVRGAAFSNAQPLRPGA